MGTHSGTLAWKVPWMEEPDGLKSMGSRRVRHEWATSLSLYAFMCWRRKWQPTPVLLPGESQGRRSLVGCRLRGRAWLQRLTCKQQQLLPSVSVSTSLCSLIKTAITGFGTTLIQYDLILTNYICKDTISKQSHVLRFQVDMNLRWHYSTHYADDLRLTDTVWFRTTLPSFTPYCTWFFFLSHYLFVYIYILPFWTTDILSCQGLYFTHPSPQGLA